MAAIPPGSETPQQVEEAEEAAAVAESAAAAAEVQENGVMPDATLPQDLVFDLQLVLDGFSECRGEDGQLYLDAYLRAYSELNKFLQLLGTIFNFVSHDIQKKMTGGVGAVRAHNEALMPKVIEVMNSVYNLTQKLYEDYNILDLP
ncbi:Ceramide-1-phosphate transfer protein [Portunus trituberculatus]|uniref:Ceramide-1-phosphate transfer protein n=1 Tax=Portunus trituberculatus TaxID=210409 RepID=A0A5B7EU88_PORTR|nr:Ceramide-1-phosphate transfer protein [Portunus trituberculatus]